MIELFYADTPNGKKISIMLEEIKFKYKITVVNLNKGEQFNSKFRSISPFSKIPVITDHEKKISIFESGAILIYLAEKSGKFYDKKTPRTESLWKNLIRDLSDAANNPIEQSSRYDYLIILYKIMYTIVKHVFKKNM